MGVPNRLQRFFISRKRIAKAKASSFVCLPSFTEDNKNVPDEYGYCIYCGKELRDANGNIGNYVWFVNGYHCDKDRNKSMKRFWRYMFNLK